jgi:hypothetical protein
LVGEPLALGLAMPLLGRMSDGGASTAAHAPRFLPKETASAMFGRTLELIPECRSSGQSLTKEPSWVLTLLQVYIQFCLLGVGYGSFLAFLRTDGSFVPYGSFATTFANTQFLAFVNAFLGCMLSGVQAKRSVFAIRSDIASALPCIAIMLAIHTVTFTATVIVLILWTFPGLVWQNVASAVHICLQVPSSIAVIHGLVNYRRWLHEQRAARSVILRRALVVFSV